VYALEFREQVVELARARWSARTLVQEREPSEQTSHNWIRRPELILAKAVARFAQETAAVPLGVNRLGVAGDSIS